MSVIHHSAICVRDMQASLSFWRDGLGFQQLMDLPFDGDWPTLLKAPSTRLRAVFLGNPAQPDSGIVELVDMGELPPSPTDAQGPVTSGFLLLSVVTGVEAALSRLAELGLGGEPRRVTVSGIKIAVVVDPSGVQVELVDPGASDNLARLRDDQ